MPHLITQDGRRLAWREDGSGEPLLLHPGGPGMSSVYFGDLPELASERTLVRLDPRGAGESDRPSDATAFELADYADDVEEVRRHLAPETSVEGLGELLDRAGANADALRYFNEHVVSVMDHRAALAGVSAPTLVITGGLDPFGESTAREIADALPNATLVVLPGADHLPFLEPENRVAWSRAVARFLAG